MNKNIHMYPIFVIGYFFYAQLIIWSKNKLWKSNKYGITAYLNGKNGTDFFWNLSTFILNLADSCKPNKLFGMLLCSFPVFTYFCKKWNKNYPDNNYRMNFLPIDIKDKMGEGLTFKISRFKEQIKKQNPTNTKNITS